MTPKRHWRDMPTTSFGAHCADWVAVLPLAAIEQHGPHLPVGVDAFIAEGLIARCAAALPDNSPATFLPLQQVCKSNEHISFAGTLTLDWETTIKSWLQIGESVARAGVRKFVMITSHGGNVAAMDIVARELRQRHALLALTTSFGRLGDWQNIYDYDEVITDIHGGNAETSLMLALRPDLVDMTKAEDFASRQSALKAQHRHLGLHSSDANIAWLAEDLNPAGTVGDAAAANAENGERDIASVVSGFVRLIEEVANTDPPNGSA